MDLILYKEDDRNRWSGPAKVTGCEGNKVRVVHAGYDRTVPLCRVIPFVEEKHLADEVSSASEDEDRHISLPDNSEVSSVPETVNRDLRPKIHRKIKFQLMGENQWRTGKVIKVGKKEAKTKTNVGFKMDKNKSMILIFQKILPIGNIW